MASSLLILGGTGEAAALARAAAARFGERLNLTTALAGRTRRPGPLPGQIRIGGFGGADGLASWLAAERIDRLVDATHPFAARMSRTARLACNTVQVPRLVLQRPPWRPQPGDRWFEVDDLAQAVAGVGRLGLRALLTIGGGEAAAFAAAAGVHFVVRLIDPPHAPLPLPSHEVVIGRGPFALADERRLLQDRAIDVVVCKASGGAATEAKLIAARQLGLPVLMLRRPPPEPGVTVESVEAALAWLAAPAILPDARLV